MEREEEVLSINMADVMNVLSLCAPYLIFFAVVLVAAIVVSIAVRKMALPRKKFVRAQAGIAVIAALAIAGGLIAFGPMSSMLTLVTGASPEPSAESIEQAKDTSYKIADEGIVMLKNDDSTLPLTSGKLNVFGWSSTSPCYGGSGSGSLNDNYDTTTLIQGLNDAGVETNTELTDFYTNSGYAHTGAVSFLSSDWSLPEVPVDQYSDSLVSDAQDFSDTAMIVITRTGGEGNDLPSDMSTAYASGAYTDNSTEYADFQPGQSYLTLSQTEKNMIDLVTSKFDNVIVLYSGANTMEMGWVDQYPQIKSVLWFPGAGQVGFESLGKIITGEVNPSGKTADTFVYDLTTTPWYNNFGNYKYDNMSEYADTTSQFLTDPNPSFVNYVEGIYVGYRYYETAADEGSIDYGSTVQYPFGYGLSYTTFSQTMTDLKTGSDGSVSFDVTVTNTGSVAGKDVVEAYYNPPYTNGGIEKASANLVQYDKTELLEPGASQTLTISFNEEDMASYDTTANGGAGSYVLESGDYVISINSDSHHVIDSRTLNVGSTVTYSGDNARSTDKVAATNEFADASGDVTYLSRADHFANYAEATAAPSSYSLSDEYKAEFVNTSNYDASSDEDVNATMPTTGAKNGLTLSDLRGVDYDDPQWDSLLDQLTVEDMNKLIGHSGYATAAVDSVGKIATTDCDGPAAINNNFTGKGSIGLPTNLTLANTWNKQLATLFGEAIGKMASDMDVSGWYAPSMNTHRTAFGGRNFEYFSEDGVLGGYMAAGQEAGAYEYGVYGYIKHFALNDQETNRWAMVCTWSNEQAIREIYLKPFELAVKDGGATAVMSSYNYIGTTWAGGDSALLQDVLRNEWGFKGMVISDYFGGFGFMNADQAIRNGTDTMLAPYDIGANLVTKTTSAGSVQAMRTAAKDILYTTVNSNAYANGSGSTGLATWQIVGIVVLAVVAAVVALLEFLSVRNLKRRTAA